MLCRKYPNIICSRRRHVPRLFPTYPTPTLSLLNLRLKSRVVGALPSRIIMVPELKVRNPIIAPISTLVDITFRSPCPMTCSYISSAADPGDQSPLQFRVADVNVADSTPNRCFIASPVGPVPYFRFLS